MSNVIKRNRKTSSVVYFDYAYTVIEGITRFLLLDFGVTHTYSNLKVFCAKANMTKQDKSLFETLVDKYHLDTEHSYPLWLLIHYRDRMLDIMDSLLGHITYAHTMFPNSVYEFNVKRQHQSDAIADCYNLKHTLQLAINIFPADLKKYVPYIEMIDNEIAYIKTWRKDYAAKYKKQCYISDENNRRKASEALNKVIIKEENKMTQNQETTTQSPVQNLDPSSYKLAIIFFDDRGNIITDN